MLIGWDTRKIILGKKNLYDLCQILMDITMHVDRVRMELPMYPMGSQVIL